MKIEEISLWEAFFAVAKQGNFSKAAKHLNLNLPQLSKRVSKLEDSIGVRLFQRSTRHVSLTEEGQALLPKITTLLEDWSEAESFFNEKKKSLSGTIRITCVPFVAERLLIPVITAFNKQHPQISIDLDLSENFINLVESSTDIAIRIHSAPADSSLIYRKLLPNTLIACATPKYLKAHGAIKKPKDLFDHELLALPIHHKCQFGDSGVSVGSLAKSKKINSDNGWFLTRLALKDFGVLIRSKWDVQEALKSGELVEVLKNNPLGDYGNIYAVIPTKRLLAPRVSTFLEFLAVELKKW